MLFYSLFCKKITLNYFDHPFTCTYAHMFVCLMSLNGKLASLGKCNFLMGPLWVRRWLVCWSACLSWIAKRPIKALVQIQTSCLKKKLCTSQHHKNATKIMNQNKFFKKFVSCVSFQFVGISLGEAFRAGWTSVLAKVWIINTNCITK